MTGAKSYPGGRYRRGAAATVAVLALGATLTACFEDRPVTAPSGNARPVTSTVTVTATPSSRSVAPSNTMLSGLRIGPRDGADRLVLQFTGAVPRYTIARAAGPITECGSGSDAGGPGEYLVVNIDPIQLVDDAGKPGYVGANTVSGPGRAISRAIITCAFEGQLQVAVKLTGNGQRYSDFTLGGPGRIVVDVRN